MQTKHLSYAPFIQAMICFFLDCPLLHACDVFFTDDVHCLLTFVLDQIIFLIMALNLGTDDVGVVSFGDDHDVVEGDSCKSWDRSDPHSRRSMRS